MYLTNSWQLEIFATGPWAGALVGTMPRVDVFKYLGIEQVGEDWIVLICVFSAFDLSLIA
uniref:Uncharacterized protein n=1 Tax=Physcomitrium patens TaxID=3218 RepID=A0A2K1J7H1_PHYPA|nr:hypothetical protein PHYPA_020580 [Physcomitrium patens]